jgi:hypothetical protein
MRGGQIVGPVSPADVDPDTLLVGKCIVAGCSELRVGVSLQGMYLHFSAADAREFAKEFEAPGPRALGLGWVAEVLREAADEIDAMPGHGRLQ